MHTWARLDIGSHQRTRWQRLKHWLFGSKGQVHISSEIAHRTVSAVVEDSADRHQLVPKIAHYG